MGRKSADRTAAQDTRELSPVDGLAQLSFVVHRMLEQRAAEHDLSIIQTRLLGVLRDRHPTINELGKLLGLDKSSTSGLVERAERRGLVARSPSPADGRSVWSASPTPGGQWSRMRRPSSPQTSPRFLTACRSTTAVH